MYRKNRMIPGNPQRTICIVVCLLGNLLHVNSAQAIDVFDRHDSELLKQTLSTATEMKEVTETQAGKLQPLSKDLEGSCFIVETNRGNLAKILVSWGYRKQPQSDKPVPVVMLDRFVTYEAGKGDSTVANGKNVMLFPGFSFDLDLGQVVPAGFDAELQLTEKGAVKALDGVKLYGVSGSQLPMAEAVAKGKNDPTVIVPEDFTGVWLVDGDGRWVGEWDLNVNEEGQATGKFLSAETQASYPITGQMGGQANQIKLQVEFNNATQVIEAYMWTKDKSKIGGSFSMQGRKFGLMATRKGE